ncbi:MAG: biotin/lipoyl-binding protein, partial [Chloroflexi bacterium]|nr:biotin/lipoyl-binding protein [Chloroflexota bacterium]
MIRRGYDVYAMANSVCESIGLALTLALSLWERGHEAPRTSIVANCCRKFALIGVTILLVFLAGCIQLPGSVAPAPVATARAVKPPTRPTAIVRRDSIVESVKVLGRVAAVREGELYFKNAGRLKKINVQSGQEVTEGQLLAEMDVGDLESRI